MTKQTSDWRHVANRDALCNACDDYLQACYGSTMLPLAQVRETRQAFLSGVHWLNTLDEYEPDAVERALRDILGADNPAIAALPAAAPTKSQRDAQTHEPNDHLSQKIEESLDRIDGPRETFRPLLDPVNILHRICRNAEGQALRRHTEPWVIIGDITGHGSGVSAAIYEIYRDGRPEEKKPNP